MTTEQTDPAESPNPSTRHTGGLYDLPVVGNIAGAVGDFFDGMAPAESDSIEVKVAKEVFRYASVVVVAAGAAVVIL